MFGVQWVLLKKVFDLLCGWRCCGPNLNIWNLIPLCLMSTIWRERNRHLFENVECTSSQIKASFINSLYQHSFYWVLLIGTLFTPSQSQLICRYYLIVILQATSCLFSRRILFTIILFLPINIYIYIGMAMGRVWIGYTHTLPEKLTHGYPNINTH